MRDQMGDNLSGSPGPGHHLHIGHLILSHTSGCGQEGGQKGQSGRGQGGMREVDRASVFEMGGWGGLR